MNSDPDHANNRGLMFIGDPHLEARVPGFRKDDFPAVALAKFRWCLRHAKANNLQPFLLGDLFQLPQDNPNWLVSAIIEAISETIDEPLPAIYGNHDVRENSLKTNDSVHILVAAGQLKLLSETDPWTGTIDGGRVVVGGTAWGQKLPKSFDRSSTPTDLVCWITHHDILIPGYEEGGRIRPKDLPGIDLVVNGHIHRRLETVSKTSTHWMTPGNITRRSRGDASRLRTPAVLCVTPGTQTECPPAQPSGDDNLTGDKNETRDEFVFETDDSHRWIAHWLTIPHEPFDDVFHPEVEQDSEDAETQSGFVANLKELTARRTETGAGLKQFLEQNVSQFDPMVAHQIMNLANEAIGSDLD